MPVPVVQEQLPICGAARTANANSKLGERAYPPQQRWAQVSASLTSVLAQSGEHVRKATRVTAKALEGRLQVRKTASQDLVLGSGKELGRHPR